MANLDDLNLDDEPIETPVSEDAENFLAVVEGLIDEDHVQYARDFLQDVMESVRSSGTVTDGQWKAVNNIDEGGQRGKRSRSRYRKW